MAEMKLRLEELLKARGITMYRLARMMGMQPSSLWRVATGKVKPTWETIERICVSLNCQPGDILYIEFKEEAKNGTHHP